MDLMIFQWIYHWSLSSWEETLKHQYL